MIHTIGNFYSGAEKYIKLFDDFVKKHSLQNITKADHICYKCDSKKSFERIRSMLEGESEYIFQSIISNRRIAYIKLKKGFKTVLGTIQFLELSDQKPDGTQTDRFDHIEVYPKSISYNEMVKRLEKTERVIKAERPHHPTHDIEIGSGFVFRCTKGLLIKKIKKLEMI